MDGLRRVALLVARWVHNEVTMFPINRIWVQNAGTPAMMFAVRAPAMQRGGYAFKAASA
jgi:hypothetical protein